MYAKYEITWYSATTVQLKFIFKTENIGQTFNKNDKLALRIEKCALFSVHYTLNLVFSLNITVRLPFRLF